MRALTIGLSAVATFLLVFIVALHLHFPGQKARDRLAWQVQEATGGAWMLQASDAHLYRGTGLSLDDAVLLHRATPLGRRKPAGTDTSEVPATPILRTEHAAVRMRLLPMLKGQRSAAYDLGLYGGDLSGDVTVDATTQRLRIHGVDIDLSKIPLEGEQWSLDAAGTLSIDGDLSFNSEDVKQSEGGIHLDVDGLMLRSATVMGMTLEPTPFTEATLGFNIDQGKAQVTKGHFASDPVDVVVDGEIALNKILARSRLKLDLKIKFNDQFDRLARMAPALVSARDTDGVYHFKVTGTLENPRFREDRLAPARGATRPGTMGIRPPPGGLDDEGAQGDPPTGSPDLMDADARREQRRERIAERRKRMMERRDGAAGAFAGPGMPALNPDGADGMGVRPGMPQPLDQQRFRDGEEVLGVEVDPPFANDPGGEQDMGDQGEDQGPYDDQQAPEEDQGDPAGEY